MGTIGTTNPRAASATLAVMSGDGADAATPAGSHRSGRDGHGLDVSWIRAQIVHHGLFVWFVANSLVGIAYAARDTRLLFFDARLYLMATQTWLSGGDPWTVQLAGNYYAAPPPSLLPLVPFALLPLDLGVAVIAALCFASAIATVRLLRLPLWWLLFPPLVQCLLSANVHAALIPLILIGGGWLATLLKLYAGVTVVILGRWRSVIIVLMILIVTIPVLPWGLYIGQFSEITARLAEQTKHDIPLAVLLAAAPFVALGLVLVGRERAAWLAPLALWPSQQYYYGTLVMPTRSQVAAAIVALPVTGSGLFALAALSALEWRDGKRFAKPEVSGARRVLGRSAR